MARAQAVEKLAILVREGEAGDPAGLDAAALVSGDLWLARAVRRANELGPLLLAEETELLLVSAEVAQGGSMLWSFEHWMKSMLCDVGVFFQPHTV